VPTKIANATSKSLATSKSSTAASGTTQQHQQQLQNQKEATPSQVFCNLKT
jgi:hypothetical protein